MRDEYEIYLTVFAQQLASKASSDAARVVKIGLSCQAAAALAVLDVKLVEQGKREDVRSYSGFADKIEHLIARVPAAPSSAA